MTTEIDAAPGAAAGSPAPEEIANTPEVATPEVEAKPEPSDHDKSIKKLERRIGNVTRSRYEAEARAQQAEERAARLERELQERQSKQSEPQGDVPRTQQRDTDDLDARVTQRAEEIATIREVTRRSNDIATKGKQAYGDDFMSSVAAVQDEAGPLFERSGLPTALGEAVLDSEDPAALLHYLGQNPEEAEDLRDLNAAQLGRRIAKLEAKLSQAPTSKPAPTHKPVTPQATARSKPHDQMSDAEWAAARKAKR